MSQHKLRKDLDEYLSKRADKTPKKRSIKDFFHKREFSDRHMTIKEDQIGHIGEADGSGVMIIQPEKNFFKILHDRILGLFNKNRKKSKDDSKDTNQE